MRGGGVRARAHACVALGRCVAFGRPKMSVWGHAGARSRTAKVACISFLRPFFGTYLMFRFRFFGFRRCRRRLCLHTTTPPVPTRSMEALDRAPDAGRRSRSPSPDAALRPSPTTPVAGTGCEQSAVTPCSSDADYLWKPARQLLTLGRRTCDAVAECCEGCQATRAMRLGF